MQKFPFTILGLVLCFFLACENEVDLNTDFEETTVILGILDHNADTQFVKINKTFLEDGESAIDLAKESDRLFFDSLRVSIKAAGTAETISLQKMDRPKEAGLFADDQNIIYFTDKRLNKNTTYELIVERTDGVITTSKTTTTLDTIFIASPRIRNNNANKVIFFNSDSRFNQFSFTFITGRKAAEFQVVNYFHYKEIIGADTIDRSIRIPLTRFENPDTALRKEFSFFV